MYTKLYNFILKDLSFNLNDIGEITLLGGLNNLCFKVEYLNQFYFVRISNNSQKNLNEEKNIIKLCVQSALAPNLYYFSTKTGNMITEWITGFLPSETEFSSPSFIDNLVKKLKILHNSKSSKYFHPFFEIKHNIELCRYLNLELPSYIDILLDKLKDIELFCSMNLDYGLCHNDLNPSNFIISKDNLYIIDYEFSAMGDIFFDLATLTWMMSIEGKELLLKTYFKTPNEYHYKKLSYYTFVVKFWNATWSLLKSQTSTCDYDYKKGAYIIFEELFNS